mmetsp:Transcript_35396/g.65572  ORF Transcript_35396/g.65572 Transcript_35396/m.65572 type:complete len:81 (+) Transcript_35396:152-394(+)
MPDLARQAEEREILEEFIDIFLENLTGKKPKQPKKPGKVIKRATRGHRITQKTHSRIKAWGKDGKKGLKKGIRRDWINKL